MLTGAILLLSFCLNVYSLLKLHRATRALNTSHEALLAAIRKVGPGVNVGIVQSITATPRFDLDTTNIRKH